uniref:helix-turn-helix domain-containing protein n=1 Tax=uncultured Fusobacterium sp. TaxID=159267 RepID=UPI0025F167F8
MFGKVLKEIRLKNGDSLKALGEKSEVSFSYIDRIERGEKSVSDKIFEKLLEIYPLDRNKLIKA